MAYNNSGEVDMGKSAKFNGGILQTQRVHEINEELNRAEQDNPTFIYERNDWNFNITLNGAYNLYKECKSKLSEKEQKDCDKHREALKRFLKEHPIVERKISVNSPQGKIYINKVNWLVFKKALEQYEEKIRVLADEHGIGAPANDDDDGL